MTTGSKFSIFTHGRLLAKEDFEERLSVYVRRAVELSVRRLFIGGAFDEKMPISSPGADQVQIDVKPTFADRAAHDGDGHIMDLPSGESIATFENVNTQVYEVGFAYVEYPEGIRPNVSTGAPEYDHMVEGVGVEADPDTVADNENSTITLRVDSLFEDGVTEADHTGRSVRVFMKVPAEGVTTDEFAVEIRTVAFAGGENTITTATKLGQSIASEIAADYTVQLIGLIVLKNTATNRPSQVATRFLAGTVTGNAGTPTVFSTAAQNVIAAQGASLTTLGTFTGAAPLSWAITSTDVQAAMEEIVADLSTNDGSNKVAFNANASGLTAPLPTLDADVSWGGVKDATAKSVKATLDIVNQQLERSRSGITHSALVATIKADFEGVESIATAGEHSTHLLKGAGNFQFTSIDVMDTDKLPHVHGEGMNKTILLPRNTTGVKGFKGIFENLKFGYNSQTDGFGFLGGALSGYSGSSATEGGSFHARNCIITPWNYTLGAGQHSADSVSGVFERYQPHSLVGCIVSSDLIVPGSGTPSSILASLVSVPSGAGPKLISNCYFKSDNKIAVLEDTHAQAGQDVVMTVYQNCVFHADGDSATEAVRVKSSYVTFIGCMFLKTGQTTEGSYAVYIDDTATDGVTFDSCYFFSDAAGCLKVEDGASASFNSCVFKNHPTKSPISADIALVHATGAAFNSCKFVMGDSTFHSSGDDFGVYLISCRTTNCEISFDVTNMPTQTPVTITANENPGKASYTAGLIVTIQNPAGSSPIAGTAPAWVGIKGPFSLSASDLNPPTVQGLTIRGEIAVSDTQSNNEYSVLAMIDCSVDGLVLDLTWINSSVSDRGLDGIVFMRHNCRLQKVFFNWVSDNNQYQVKSDSAIITMNSQGCDLEDVQLSGGPVYHANSGRTLLIKCACNNTSIDNVRNSLRDFTGSFIAIEDFGGDRIRISRNTITTGDGGIAGDKYIDNTRVPSTTIQVVNNIFSRVGSSTDVVNTNWCNLSDAGATAGKYSVVDGNVFINKGATAPDIQAVNTSVIGDNVKVASATDVDS